MSDMTSRPDTPQRTRLREDVTVMVAGQGGDGSLTIIALLSGALRRRGLEFYQTSNIASRIKGGHAAAMIRIAEDQHGGLGDHVDVLVAFDDEAVRAAAPSLAPDAIVIYDTSREPLPAGCLPPGATVYEVPFSRHAVRDLRRDLFKNGFAFGLLARIFGIGEAAAEDSVRRRFKKLSPRALEGNLDALRLGLGEADGFGLRPGNNPIALPDGEPGERILITGNEATAFGFLAAGGRFYAGYPITPATEIIDWLARHAPPFGGVVIQAEDELSAINLAIGAALTGARAMTGSSGPGIALMGESISHCGSAEIPLVVVDCQRAGPSTGMPTKTEQGDIAMLAHGGGGDFPHLVLCPGDPGECFAIAALATDLAQVGQLPVLIALDRSTSQNAMTVPPFDLGAVAMEVGRLLYADAVRGLETYQRYAITEDGISPWAVPGTPGGMNLVTGNERNPWGQVSTEPANRKAMVDKRARKIEAIRDRLPRAVEWGDRQASIGLLGAGMEAGVMAEAAQRLGDSGLAVRCHRPRTLWPVLDDTIAFAAACSRVYVVEHNQGGQLQHLLGGAGVAAETLRPIRKYDGLPFGPGELAARILEAESGP